MKRFLVVTILSCSIFVSANSEDVKKHRVLVWKSPIETTISEVEKVKSLFFDQASYNADGLPVYYEKIELATGNTATVTVINAVFEPLKETELISENTKINSELQVTTEIGVRRKKYFACITILPFRKTASGQIEKLISFDFNLVPSNSSNRIGDGNQSARFYSKSSVLSSGTWYKIAVTQNGIHKITYQFLKNIGVDINKIDPRNIRLYGNGGGQLPYGNSPSRHDDLQQNSIYVEGEVDGKFDPTDYILFYGQNQTKWAHNSTSNSFTHSLNDYSDSTFYFLTVDLGTGKRIQPRSSSSGPNQTITSFDDYAYHEVELMNPLKSGRKWYGEQFDNLHQQFSFSFSMPNLLSSDPLYITSAIIGRSTSSSCLFNIYVNNTLVDSKSTSKVCTSTTCDFAAGTTLKGSIITGNPNLNVMLSFSSSDPSGRGWLDYIEVYGRRALSFSNTGNQLFFRDTRSLGAGNIGQFILSNGASDLKIWDVSDPTNVAEQQTYFTNGQNSFAYPTNTLHEYVAFKGSNFPSPSFSSLVENQDLHAMRQATFIIVTNSKFLPQANELADFHRKLDGYIVNVATTDQVFNEFSSGSPDASAIRDFTKMFYDRATSASDLPKFLLLFGDGSFDNKNRTPGNTNPVPTYQSDASLNLTTTYVSDDFFGLLDDTEGDWSPNTSNELLDISVGRLPVNSQAEADALLKKIISYASPDPSSTSNSSTSFGDWRNIVTFIGDDQDQNIHFQQADNLSNTVKSKYPVYNIDKIYLDAYKQEATPGGQRFPDAREAIVNRVERGTLLTTYVGHGGPVGWAHERVLENSDINGWTNFNHLSAFLTATCDFSTFDNPDQVSAGELVILNPKGGGICLYTTTRLAFSGSNYSLAQRFFSHVFTPINGVMPTSGEVFEQTKIDYNDRYTRNFVLLGDPALRLAYPKFNVATSTINSHQISTGSDTLSALSKVTITGEIRDNNNKKMTTFNGIVYPTVYDKWTTYYTMANDLGYTGEGGSSSAAPFDLQKNILYKGKTNVKNGDFSFTFIVPKDISYKYGFGKLSYYAQNGQIDGNGFDTSIVIGGVNFSAPADNKGPIVNIYMNDDKFVFGGLTDPNPILFAIVEDENGINTSGNGIGHDITSILDEDNSKLFVLNDYYEADLNSYQSGKVRYPLNNLAEGRHSINLKVWDAYNNSADARTEFIVASSASLALDHVLNYPNPFTTHTTFMFEHNHAFSLLQTEVQIFTVSGKLVKTLRRSIFAEGYRSNEIEWDGLDDYGDRIGRGVYVYKLKVKAEDGTTAEKFEKLVILR